MAWTAPRTWTTGEVPSASNFNTHLRDNLLETEGAKAGAAGQIIRATGATALGALAAGAAGAHLIVNSGANDVEWRSRDQLYPWIVDIYLAHLAYTAASAGWTQTATGTAAYYGRALENANAGANSYLEWALLLAQGTWSLEVMYERSTDKGILTFKIDGSSVGTVDTYNAVTSPNVQSTVAGIAVSASGKHTLRVESTTKHASSSSYEMTLQHIRLLRTA